MISKVLVLALLAVAVSAQQTCDLIRMNKCTNDLNKYWGGQNDMSSFWKDPKEFNRVYTDQFKLNYTVDGYVQVCNGMSLLYYCLGRDNVERCLGVRGLAINGLNVYDAYTYDGFFNRIRFECGDAIYPIVNNPDLARCIQSSKVNLLGKVLESYDTYKRNIEHDIADNVCLHAQTLVSDIFGFYQQGPCRTTSGAGVASWFACEGTRQHILAQFRHCERHLHCARHQLKAGEELPMPENLRRNEATGQLEFLIRERFSKDSNGLVQKEPARWVAY